MRGKTGALPEALDNKQRGDLTDSRLNWSEADQLGIKLLHDFVDVAFAE
jgi:hypothetical protein